MGRKAAGYIGVLIQFMICLFMVSTLPVAVRDRNCIYFNRNTGVPTWVSKL